jgi:hypothetical protein
MNDWPINHEAVKAAAAAVRQALPPQAAKLLAVEILLTDPESLGNDPLEGDLYLLRDELRGLQPDERGQPRSADKTAPPSGREPELGLLCQL